MSDDAAQDAVGGGDAPTEGSGASNENPGVAPPSEDAAADKLHQDAAEAASGSPKNSAMQSFERRLKKKIEGEGVSASQQPRDEKIRHLDERIQKKLHQDLAGRPGPSSKQSSSDNASVGNNNSEVQVTLESQIQKKISRQAKVQGSPRRIPSAPKDEASSPRSVSGNDAIAFLDERIRRKTQMQPIDGTPEDATDAGVSTFADRIDQKIKSDLDTPGGSTSVTIDGNIEQVDSSPPLPWAADDDGAEKTRVQGSVEQIEDQCGPTPSPSTLLYEQKLVQSSNERVLNRHEDTIGPEEDAFYDNYDVEEPLDDATPTTAQSRQMAHAPEQSHEAPFFAVEATLVQDSSHQESSSSESSSSVFDAVLVPEQSSLPWWKRTKTRKMGIALTGTALVAAIVAIAVTSPTPSDSKAENTSPPNHPPPLNCTASHLGPVYEEHCWSCIDIMDEDNQTIAMSRDEDSTIQFMSIVDGKMMTNSKYSIDFWPGTLALSGDYLAAGDPYEDDDWIGAVHVIEKDASGVWNETAHIIPSNIDKDAEFGTSIDLDGDIMVVGAPNDRKAHESGGSVFIYRRLLEGTWLQETKLAPDGPVEHFGSNVLVNGSMVIVADKYHGSDFGGAAFVYKYDSSTSQPAWNLNQTIMNDGCDGNLGYSISFSDDGGLLLGCPDKSPGGAVYYYKNEGGVFVQQQAIMPGDTDTVTKFGYELATSGHFLAVGTADKVDAKVYVYALDKNVWKEVTQIDSPANSQTNFGRDIVMSGHHILATTWENTYLHELGCSEWSGDRV